MHPLAAKLFHKEIRVFLFGKAENTVPFPLPNNGVAVFRKREAVHPAELPVFLKVRASALLFW
jgi:hypothetical protein